MSRRQAIGAINPYLPSGAVRGSVYRRKILENPRQILVWIVLKGKVECPSQRSPVVELSATVPKVMRYDLNLWIVASFEGAAYLPR